MLNGWLARGLLVGALLFSGIVAVLAWICQQRAAALAEWLLSEEALSEIFSYLQYRARNVNGEASGTMRFTKRDVIEIVGQIMETRLSIPAKLTALLSWVAKRFRFRSKQTDQTFEYRIQCAISRLTNFGALTALQVEQIVTIHLDELARREIIREASDKKIEVGYLIDKSAFEGL